MGADVLGVGVIGLGVGRQHAVAYAALRQCRVVALCDRNQELARSVAREVGAAATTPDYRDLLADPRIDIVSIASQDDDHFEQAVGALRSGKHVFVEKPLCRSWNEAEAIKTQWREAERHLASNLVLRAAPLYQWLRDAIASGELGEIYAFDGDYLYGRLHKITEGWRKDVANYSVMQGGGIHLVDLMLWLTGQRPDAVAAVGGDVIARGSAFKYQDFAAATFRFSSGLVGRVTANFGCVHRHQHVVRVFGANATFIYDDRGPRLHESRDPQSTARTIDHAPLPATKGDLIEGFVDSVLAGRDPMAAGQHELDVVSVCLAADRAVETRQHEKVSYV